MLNTKYNYAYERLAILTVVLLTWEIAFAYKDSPAGNFTSYSNTSSPVYVDVEGAQRAVLLYVGGRHREDGDTYVRRTCGSSLVTACKSIEHAWQSQLFLAAQRIVIGLVGDPVDNCTVYYLSVYSGQIRFSTSLQVLVVKSLNILGCPIVSLSFFGQCTDHQRPSHSLSFWSDNNLTFTFEFVHFVPVPQKCGLWVYLPITGGGRATITISIRNCRFYLLPRQRFADVLLYSQAAITFYKCRVIGLSRPYHVATYSRFLSRRFMTIVGMDHVSIIMANCTFRDVGPPITERGEVHLTESLCYVEVDSRTILHVLISDTTFHACRGTSVLEIDGARSVTVERPAFTESTFSKAVVSLFNVESFAIVSCLFRHGTTKQTPGIIARGPSNQLRLPQLWGASSQGADVNVHYMYDRISNAAKTNFSVTRCRFQGVKNQIMRFEGNGSSRVYISHEDLSPAEGEASLPVAFQIIDIAAVFTGKISRSEFR